MVVDARMAGDLDAVFGAQGTPSSGPSRTGGGAGAVRGRAGQAAEEVDGVAPGPAAGCGRPVRPIPRVHV